MSRFYRFLCVLVLGGLVAGACGCASGSKSPPPEESPAKTPPQPATAPPPTAPAPAPSSSAAPPNTTVPLPIDDPRHVALRSYRAAVGGREEEIAAALLRLDAAAEKVAAAGPVDQRAALDEFRKLVPLLREASRTLLADHRAVLDATETLVKDLRHGPTAYRQAARAWRERAEDYTVEAFRKNALGYADEFDRYAGLLPERRKEIAAFAEELREQLPFLRELGSSIDDLARFLEQHPGTGLPDPRPQYVAQLRGYATPLTVFQELVRKYLDAIRTGSVSPALQPGYAPEKARTSADGPLPKPQPAPAASAPTAALPPPTVELIRIAASLPPPTVELIRTSTAARIGPMDSRPLVAASTRVIHDQPAHAVPCGPWSGSVAYSRAVNVR